MSKSLTDTFKYMRRGILEYAVLSVLSHGRAYSSDILDRLSKTLFKTSEGTLYPLLSKLQREGKVEYEWEESSQGPPRKYHTLTTEGQEFHSQLQNHWNEINKEINNILQDNEINNTTEEIQ